MSGECRFTRSCRPLPLSQPPATATHALARDDPGGETGRVNRRGSGARRQQQPPSVILGIRQARTLQEVLLEVQPLLNNRGREETGQLKELPQQQQLILPTSVPLPPRELAEALIAVLVAIAAIEESKRQQSPLHERSTLPLPTLLGTRGAPPAATNPVAARGDSPAAAMALVHWACLELQPLLMPPSSSVSAVGPASSSNVSADGLVAVLRSLRSLRALDAGTWRGVRSAALQLVRQDLVPRLLLSYYCYLQDRSPSCHFPFPSAEQESPPSTPLPSTAGAGPRCRRPPHLRASMGGLPGAPRSGLAGSGSPGSPRSISGCNKPSWQA